MSLGETRLSTLVEVNLSLDMSGKFLNEVYDVSLAIVYQMEEKVLENRASIRQGANTKNCNSISTEHLFSPLT